MLGAGRRWKGLGALVSLDPFDRHPSSFPSLTHLLFPMAPILDKIKQALNLDGSSSTSESPAAAAASSTPPSAAGQSSATASPADVSTAGPAVDETPAFSKDEVVVLFVLGGPGVGACGCQAAKPAWLDLGSSPLAAAC